MANKGLGRGLGSLLGILDDDKELETKKPEDCYVYPPADTYIQTSTIL